MLIGVLQKKSTCIKIGFYQFFQFPVFNVFVRFSKKTVVGFQPWTYWSFLWTYLDPFGLYILNIYLFWQQCIVIYLKCAVSCESAMHHCVQFSRKKVVGFQSWTCWSFSWTDLALVDLYTINISSFWVTEKCTLFEIFCCERFKSLMHHWVQFSKVKLDDGFKPWTAQS